MNCAYHNDISAENQCKSCGRGLCAACHHQIRGNAYCQDCLVQGAEIAEKIHTGKTFLPNPTKAALCAIIPGLGQVYNGMYSLALKQFAIFITLSWISDELRGPIHLATVCFYFYMIFDAFRTAQLLQAKALQGEPVGTGGFDLLEEKQTPVWGITMIVLGVIFLLNNLRIIDETFVRHVWPLALIGGGAYLIYRHMKKSPQPAAVPPPPQV